SPGQVLYDGVIGATVLPGTYDVIYARDVDTDGYFWAAAPGDPYPTGYAVLMEDVVIGAGASTLDIDIPAAHISGTITLEGGALTDSRRQAWIEIGLRNQSTGSINVID